MNSSKKTLFEEPLPGDEIVVTGMSGKFPSCQNVDEFLHKLVNAEDMIGENYRWDTKTFPNLPTTAGLIGDLTKLDANFFGVHFKQAQTIDPVGRIILEKAYEAILDAGVNPVTLRNTKTGVYMASNYSDTEKSWMNTENQIEGFRLTGSCRAMLANRTSYCLGLRGPSYVVDAGCSGVACALDLACKAIISGEIDNALVGSGVVILHPAMLQQYAGLGVLSPDECRPFDENANGFIRSESVAVVYLQKAKNAKRIYAEIYHTKANTDRHDPENFTYAPIDAQVGLLNEFYQEIPVNPRDVQFVECFGIAAKDSDRKEVLALDEIFCGGRSKPLLIGSVKSNMGHTDGVSALCSAIKVCFQMYYGQIAPNLRLKQIKKDLTPIHENRMKVVTETTPFEGEWAAINSFSLGGANVHILMKRLNKKKKVNNGKPSDDIPRLVCVSGRTKEAVTELIEHFQAHPVDTEYVALFHNIYKDSVPGHLYRGYALLTTDDSEDAKKLKEITQFDEKKRPVWFMYSGMGSQWPGMAKTLMTIPVFSESIKRSADILKRKNVDLYKIILDEDPTIFDEILNSFVGIAAVQVALTDLLFAVGIKPDHIIGHSVGELGCAYADGCFTQEQMILAAYARGYASSQAKVIRGAMAAVGIGYEKVKPLCPPDIDVACRNSDTSCTISGPYESIQNFVADLTSKSIFARAVNTANIAYHSRYIKEIGPELLKRLQQEVPTPKPRSSKWISTSIPESEWNSELAKYSSPEYHTNNLLSPVLFEDAAKHIHSDAIVIEIAPHGLLQAIVKRSLPATVSNFALTQRGLNNQDVLLTTLGRLYNEGVNGDLSALYPKVEFPVSAGTPAISPHIKWLHSEDWAVVEASSGERKQCAREVELSLKNEKNQFLSGHVVNDRNLVPAAAYLHMVWESLCNLHHLNIDNTPAVFEDVRFERPTISLSPSHQLNFTTVIQIGNGKFEITESGKAVVSGQITIPEDVDSEIINLKTTKTSDKSEDILLKSDDFYKEFHLRGYNYKGLFRNVQEYSINNKSSKISWNNNWVAFMDGMMQTKTVNFDTRTPSLPSTIEKIIINPRKHLEMVGETSTVNCIYDSSMDIIQAGGIEIRDMLATPISHRQNNHTVLEQYNFVPFHVTTKYSEIDALHMFVQIVLENHPHLKFKVVEKWSNDHLLATTLSQILNDLPLVRTETVILSKNNIQTLPEHVKVDDGTLSQYSNVSFVIDSNLLSSNSQSLAASLLALRDGGCIISREQTQLDEVAKSDPSIIASIPVNDEYLVLISSQKGQNPATNVIEIKNRSADWLNPLKESMKKKEHVIVFSMDEPTNGIIGLVNCLHKEPGGEQVRCVFVTDKEAPKFDINEPFYKNQLSKNLAINVYKNGSWGSFRHLQFEAIDKIATPHSHVVLKTPGDLSTLTWVSGPLTDNTENVVDIYYSAINLHDVQTATCLLTDEFGSKDSDNPIGDQGIEFVGRDRSGNRVMGIVEGGALGTRVVADEQLTWKVPDSWSLEDAATIPLAYSTAYYALIMIGEMQTGMKVLIHAGTSDVSLAAINIALHYKCTVYTTVANKEEREFIKRTFPQITDAHIASTNDTTFENMIRRQTKGEGIDMVLNSLAEDKLQASLRCVGLDGKFLELGTFDLVQNSSMGMEMFLKQTSVCGVRLGKHFFDDNDQKKTLYDGVNEHIAKGIVKPLPRSIFKTDEIENAYRCVARGKNSGKVLVEIRKEEGTKITSSRTVSILAEPRFFCDSSKSYVIVDGFEAFGLELINWMVTRGAKKIVVCSRTGITSGYQAMKMRMWKAKNVTIEVSSDDLTTDQGVIAVLQKASQLGEVDGIFNLAGVSDSGVSLFKNQTVETLVGTLHSKALATRHFDEISRFICPTLRHFVVFLSTASGRGNAGQSISGMANSIVERMCEERKAQKLPALAVQWGPIDVGVVNDNVKNRQNINDCLEVLDGFLNSNKSAVVASMIVGRKHERVVGNIIENIAHMSIKDAQSINLKLTLGALGMNYLMISELKQTLDRDFGICLTLKYLRSLTVVKLTEIIKENTTSSKVNVETSRVMSLNHFPTEEQTELIVVEMTKPLKLTNKPPIFFIPGLDGVALEFNTLGSHLETKTLCLQLVPSNSHAHVEEIAASLLPAIKSNVKSTEPLNIVAHSYGTLVALEVCILLEREGYKPNVVCVDGSPQMLQALVKTVITDTENPAELETFVLNGLHDLLGGSGQDFLEEISALASWNERKTRFIEKLDTLPTKVAINSTEHVQHVCDSLLIRLKSLLNYNVESKVDALKSTQLKLVKCNSVATEYPVEDLELSVFLQNGTVDVVTIHGDDLNVLENENLSTYIQKVYA